MRPGPRFALPCLRFVAAGGVGVAWTCPSWSVGASNVEPVMRQECRRSSRGPPGMRSGCVDAASVQPSTCPGGGAGTLLSLATVLASPTRHLCTAAASYLTSITYYYHGALAPSPLLCLCSAPPLPITLANTSRTPCPLKSSQLYCTCGSPTAVRHFTSIPGVRMLPACGMCVLFAGLCH